MIIKLNKVKLEVPECNEHTQRFLSLLMSMMEKGLNNPLYQLHALSIIHTGKGFSQLVYGDEENMMGIIEQAKELFQEIARLIDKNEEPKEGEESKKREEPKENGNNFYIDDFLRTKKEEDE